MRVFRQGFLLFCLTTAALVLKPSKVGNPSIYFLKNPVSVTINKSSPAYIAFAEVQRPAENSKKEMALEEKKALPYAERFHDSFEDHNEINDWKNLDQSKFAILLTSLEADEKNFQNSAQGHDEAIKRSISSFNDSKVIVLSEMRIQKRAEAIPVPSSDLNEQPKFLNNDLKKDSYQLSSQSSATPAFEDEINLSGLPAISRDRLRQAQARSRVLNEDWQIPSLADEVKKQIDPSTSKTESSVYIASQEGLPQAGSTSAQASSSEKKQDPSQQGIRVFGKFTVSGGIGVTNEHYLELRRIENGILKEMGRVIAKEGVYSIQVASLSGELVGRVVHQGGRLEGESRARLIANAETNGRNSVEGPSLTIIYAGTVITNTKPVTGASLAGFSQKPTEQSILFGAKKETAKGKKPVEFRDLYAGSTTILKSKHPSYLTTLSLIATDRNYDVPLFNEATTSGFRSLAADLLKVDISKNQPLIWGRVTENGKPVAGAKVRVIQSGAQAPIYLNEFMFPDQQLTETGPSGFFVIAAEAEGFFSIVAEKNETVIGFANTVAESEAISNIEIESSQEKIDLVMTSYDAFSGLPVSAQVALQSSNMIYEMLEGTEVLKVSPIKRHALAQVKGAEGYLDATYLYEEAKGYAHFPLLQQAWLQNIVNQMRITQNPDAGMIVGFSPDEDFELFLPTAETTPYEVIYFNAKGEVIPEAKTGVAGGGFILVNLPESTQEVSVYLATSQRMISKLTPVVTGEVFIHLFSLN